MDLQTLWFVLIAVLWSGYFLLEGFDFGVGMLLPFLPRDEDQRDAMFASIGPVWDGNEVWLVTAGGATFAAFPAWDATMFSGLYVALLAVLFFLIVRVISFEWRTKSSSPRWRRVWLWANAVGSFGASLIWGIRLAVVFVRRLSQIRAFAMTGLGTIAVVATLFVSLFPRVMVSSTDFANSLTVSSAASAHYTLAVMSVVALIFVPLILLYQGWTYHVFRARVGGPRDDPTH